MNTRRIALTLGIVAALTLLPGCGTSFMGTSDEEKQTVVQEVAQRGFTDVTLAPDVTMNRTVYVYATYGGCRLRLEVLNGQIGYPRVGDDISPAVLDARPEFAPCRAAKSDAKPELEPGS